MHCTNIRPGICKKNGLLVVGAIKSTVGAVECVIVAPGACFAYSQMTITFCLHAFLHTALPSSFHGLCPCTGTQKKRQWTKEDDMARKIQTAFRGYRCRKFLLQLKRKKEEYDELMSKLEKDVSDCKDIICVALLLLNCVSFCSGLSLTSKPFFLLFMSLLLSIPPPPVIIFPHLILFVFLLPFTTPILLPTALGFPAYGAN